MSAMDKSTIINQVIRRKGGFVNDPADPGGATKFGISLNWYKKINPSATVEDIHNLTPGDAFNLYDQHFYLPNHVDEIPDYLQEIYFDTCVNSGPRDAVRMLQRSLASIRADLKVDGILGPITKSLLTQYRPELRRVAAFKLLDYAESIQRNSGLEKFWFGWFNRTLEFV